MSTASTKFSDFNAYHQFLQTRAGATLTTTSLTVALGGLLVRLLPDPTPDHPIPSKVLPWIGWLLGLSLIGAAIYSFRALLTGHKLRELIFLRLKGPTIQGGIDHVDCDLRDAFIEEFERKHADLGTSAQLLLITFALAAFYLLMAIHDPVMGPEQVRFSHLEADVSRPMYVSMLLLWSFIFGFFAQRIMNQFLSQYIEQPPKESVGRRGFIVVSGLPMVRRIAIFIVGSTFGFTLAIGVLIYVDHLYQPAFAPTGMSLLFRVPPPTNPARIPVNASVSTGIIVSLIIRLGEINVDFRDLDRATQSGRV